MSFLNAFRVCVYFDKGIIVKNDIDPISMRLARESKKAAHAGRPALVDPASPAQPCNVSTPYCPSNCGVRFLTQAMIEEFLLPFSKGKTVRCSQSRLQGAAEVVKTSR